SPGYAGTAHPSLAYPIIMHNAPVYPSYLHGGSIGPDFFLDEGGPVKDLDRERALRNPRTSTRPTTLKIPLSFRCREGRSVERSLSLQWRYVHRPGATPSSGDILRRFERRSHAAHASLDM